jgi:hypothetical protein
MPISGGLRNLRFQRPCTAHFPHEFGIDCIPLPKQSPSLPLPPKVCRLFRTKTPTSPRSIVNDNDSSRQFGIQWPCSAGNSRQNLTPFENDSQRSRAGRPGEPAEHANPETLQQQRGAKSKNLSRADRRQTFDPRRWASRIRPPSS